MITDGRVHSELCTVRLSVFPSRTLNAATVQSSSKQHRGKKWIFLGWERILNSQHFGAVAKTACQISGPSSCRCHRSPDFGSNVDCISGL